MNRSPTFPQSLLALAGCLLITFLAPAVSLAFQGPGDWYAGLNKPSWNPPGWLFGPVWAALYTLMAVAAWLVWKRAGLSRPLAFYGAQLALNAAWTPLFFGARQMGWALFEILLLWLAVAFTLRAFRRVHAAAGALLLPYLAWVSFATFLNFTLWRLNPA